MSMTETQKDLSDSFKYGAYVVPDNGGLTEQIVDLEVGELNGKEFIRGWAYPNKDKYYFLGTVEKRPDGWLLVNGKQRVLLKPMEQAKSKQILSMMEGM
jgi:hypothetical protein